MIRKSSFRHLTQFEEVERLTSSNQLNKLNGLNRLNKRHFRQLKVWWSSFVFLDWRWASRSPELQSTIMQGLVGAMILNEWLTDRRWDWKTGTPIYTSGSSPQKPGGRMFPTLFSGVVTDLTCCIPGYHVAHITAVVKISDMFGHFSCFLPEIRKWQKKAENKTRTDHLSQ